MIFFRVRAVISRVCFTIMLITAMLLFWQYIFISFWNGSEVQTAAQPPEVLDGGDGIKPEGHLHTDPTANTAWSYGTEDIRQIQDEISDKIDSPSVPEVMKPPRDLVETKTVDASLMGECSGLDGKLTKLLEEKSSKSDEKKPSNLQADLQLEKENGKSKFKETEGDKNSKPGVTSVPEKQKPQPDASVTVTFEQSIHSHAGGNQELKPPSQVTYEDASSPVQEQKRPQEPEPPTVADKSSAEVKHTLTSDETNSTSEEMTEAHELAGDVLSDRPRPPTAGQNNTFDGKEPESSNTEDKKSADHTNQLASDQDNSTSGNKPETNDTENKFSDRPRSIILWSYWRSGSTFAADLLVNTSPNFTFFSMEPLFGYGKRVLTKNDEPTTQEAVTFLKDLLKCDLRNHEDFVAENSQLSFMVHVNQYLSSRCAHEGTCGDVDTFSRTCLSANLHVAKITRLSVEYAKAFLDDPQFEDLQIVYLLRDPRAIMWSRLGGDRRWCVRPSQPGADPETDKVCSDPKTVCRLLADDIQVAQTIWASYKDRFFALRYEDLSSSPEATVNTLWDALHLPVTDTFLQYLQQATTDHKPPTQRTDTSRHSQNHTFEWRTKAEWPLVQLVQQECSGVLQLLGFNKFESEGQLRNLSFPVTVGGN